MSLLYAHGSSHFAVTFYDWYLDPTAVIIAVVAVFYKLGVKFYQKRSAFKEFKWRKYFFWLGFAVLVLSLCSPLDGFADNSFSMHMVQHLLLIMVSAPLILIGAPYLPLIKGSPSVIKKVIIIPLMKSKIVRKVFSFMLNPVISLIIFTLMFWVWHYPPLYDLALENEYWHLFEHFCFFYSSLLFWWNIVNIYPLKAGIGSLQKMILILGATIQNSVLSAIITFQSELIYNFGEYNPFGLDQHTDQILGGLIMWVPGSMMYITAFGVCFVSLVNKHNKEKV